MHGYFIKLGKRASGPASEEEKETVCEVFDLFQRGRGRGRGGGVGGGTCTFFKCARGGNTPDYYEVDDDTALESKYLVFILMYISLFVFDMFCVVKYYLIVGCHCLDFCISALSSCHTHFIMSLFNVTVRNQE